jgi:hypothetical protein
VVSAEHSLAEHNFAEQVSSEVHALAAPTVIVANKRTESKSVKTFTTLLTDFLTI